jgi:hypothetical protein
MGTSSPFTDAPFITPFGNGGISGISIPLSYVGSGLFWISLFASLLIAVILYYHWIRYGVGIFGTMTVMVVYALGFTILTLAALGFVTQL